MPRIYTFKTPLQKILENHVEQPTGACWEWNGVRAPGGYGVVTSRSKPYRVSRVMYEEYVGKIPPGYDVCHSCDNPPCYNPSHLFAGSRKENMQDAKSKGRLVSGDRARLRDRCRGEQHGRSKVTAQDVLEIRRMRSSGVPIKDVASKFNLSLAGVSVIANRKKWKHID